MDGERQLTIKTVRVYFSANFERVQGAFLNKAFNLMYLDYDWVREMDALRRVDVSIWDKDACIDSYKGFPKFPSSSFLCAGHQGKESCTVSYRLEILRVLIWFDLII